MTQFGPLTKSVCPQCGYVLTGADNLHGQGAPEPGNFSVCLNCGQLLIFDADLTLRRPTFEEVSALMADAAAWAAIEKAQFDIGKRGRFIKEQA